MPTITSFSQFRDIVKDLSNDMDLLTRQRADYDHPSAELFTETGNKIVSLDLKLFIEDDGGIWDSGLIRPEFMWDMKRISGNYVIDTGFNTVHSNLEIVNTSESYDGLIFAGFGNSYLKSTPVIAEFFNNKNHVFNIWFSPILPNNSLVASIFDIKYNYKNSVLKLEINQPSSGSPTLTLFVNSATINIPIEINSDSLNNVIICIDDTSLSMLINGRYYSTTITALVIDYANNSEIVFEVGKNYYGEISFIAYNCSTQVFNQSMLETLFINKYPLPRDKELVDLSDQFGHKGVNIFIEGRDFQKAIENLKGQLYVRTNEINVRNKSNGL